MPRSYSASSIPTCIAPRLAPPERTNAVRGLKAPPLGRLCGRRSAAVLIALAPSLESLCARQLVGETGFPKVASVAHQLRVGLCGALLAVKRRPICVECQRLCGGARGDPAAIRGADCVALRTPLHVSSDHCVDASASAGMRRDHGAYLKGWRNASAALTGETLKAISPSDRAHHAQFLSLDARLEALHYATSGRRLASRRDRGKRLAGLPSTVQPGRSVDASGLKPPRPAERSLRRVRPIAARSS